MKISFVIACYYSSQTIGSVLQSVERKMEERPTYEYEIIAVNDGSTDETWNVLENYARSSDKLTAINLTMNKGKHVAILAACKYAEGDIVVVVDDDMQSPVHELWRLLQPIIEDDYDVSIAQYNHKTQAKHKSIGSKVNSLIMKWYFNKPKELVFTNFIARKKYICKAMLHYENPYPHLEALTLSLTNKIAQVPMEPIPRKIGKSGYTFRKSVPLLMNGLTTFSLKPLRFIGVLGAVLAFLGGAFTLALIIIGIMSRVYYFWSLFILGISAIISGLSLIGVGIASEYIGRIYMSINKLPTYVVKDIVLPVSREEKTD